MKSIEFITESFNREYEIAEKWHFDERYTRAILSIKRDCQQFLREAGKLSLNLYRGMGSSHGDVIMDKEVYLTNRQPKGMTDERKDELNAYFTKEFGEPFRDSILATGSHMFAQAFGDVYSIFPVGNFTFLWSPDVDDINRTMHRVWFDNDDSDHEIFPEFIPNAVNSYTTQNLQQAIFSENEIMLRCSTYHAISHRKMINDKRGRKEGYGNNNNIKRVVQ